MSQEKLTLLGRVLSALVVIFLLFDAAIHVLNIPPVAQASIQLGLPVWESFVIGIVEFICIAFYIFRKTSVLGAILLTGYLGGAVATNLRAGTPLFSNTLFPVYTGLFVWGGLFLREEKIRQLVPFKK